MKDRFNLARFVDAQHGCIERVQDELRRGRKETHWMWFVFPQLAGLGNSDMARRYAISGIDEARAYLAHPVLGPRLRDLTGIVDTLVGSDAVAVFGGIDAMKFHSCMTLFDAVAPDDIFQAALAKFFAGQADAGTRAILAGQGA